jgi:hypothetical protein
MDDIQAPDLIHLLGFEKHLFKIKDNGLAAHQQNIERAYPFLSNSFNVFSEVIDFYHGNLSASRREVDMIYFVDTFDAQTLNQIVGILMRQKGLIRYLKSYPLYREGILSLNEYSMDRVNELVLSAQALLGKITEIYNFPEYSADPKMGLKEDDIKKLIDATMHQFEYIHEYEELFELHKLIKDRTQQFWIEEFSFLGDMPAFVPQNGWVGGISIRPIFQGIHKYYLKFQEFCTQTAPYHDGE